MTPDMMYYTDFVRWLEQRVEGFVLPEFNLTTRDGEYKRYYVSVSLRMQWLVRDYPDEWVAFVAARRLAGDKYIGK